MTEWHLERLRMTGGVWEGRLSGPANAVPPDLAVTWLGAEVACAQTTREVEGGWAVEVRIPTEVLADGVQTILIGPRGKEALCSETFVFGDPLADDIRSEVSLLRAELDLLKRAFRRHCAEGE